MTNGSEPDVSPIRPDTVPRRRSDGRLYPVIRWTVARKWTLVQGVRDGSLDLGDVMRAHGISAEEFASWDEAAKAGDAKALMATRRLARADVP